MFVLVAGLSPLPYPVGRASHGMFLLVADPYSLPHPVERTSHGMFVLVPGLYSLPHPVERTHHGMFVLVDGPSSLPHPVGRASHGMSSLAECRWPRASVLSLNDVAYRTTRETTSLQLPSPSLVTMRSRKKYLTSGANSERVVLA